ncbi:MAG: outer membrane lipid asymmetry maintenance protein MlaD [Micavibrio sp.]|nr:outer membrane lipid asymmetry maintenance protein MlaD [Micavibrio sp.]|tara:strand:- start:626 stop:1126 length:501 start_codon:yes stop_codon:yes gene_type:complete
MKRNVVEMVLGAVVLAVAVVFMVFSYNAADVEDVNGYAVSATFTDIGSIKQGSDVRISGVKVGSVSKVELDEKAYLAKLTLSLQDTLKLPDDTAALIGSESLLGGSYIGLEPGASDDFLADGDRIQYTQDAQNLERLLGQFIFSVKDGDKGEKAASSDDSSANDIP